MLNRSVRFISPLIPLLFITEAEVEIQLLAIQIFILFRKREPGFRIADQRHGLPFLRHGERAFHAFRQALQRHLDAVIDRVVFAERELMDEPIAVPRVGGLPHADEFLLLAARPRQHGNDQENDTAPSFHTNKGRENSCYLVNRIFIT